MARAGSAARRLRTRAGAEARPPAALLERDVEYRILTEVLDAAEDGHGSVALVFGEPGIGKTSLLRAFADSARERARVLEGACDDLLSPRAFGPWRDMVRGTQSPLAQAFAAGADRDTVLSAIQDELANPLEPTLAIIEDVQWADEATLDVLRFLGRRITGEPCMLIVSYRDDFEPSHPLNAVLGGLTGPSVHRLPLRRLSLPAVSSLMGDRSMNAADVFEVTGGNPFFISEVLASPDETVPPTVRDAVMARVRQLAPDTQAALELLAALPRGADHDLLDAMTGGAAGSFNDAERRGLVEIEQGQVRYRHELARRAVEATLPATRRIDAHTRVLAALRERSQDPALLLHHAVGANDLRAIAEFAPEAALQAARLGSHREAVAHYEQALRATAQLSPRQVADIRTRYAHELVLNNRLEDAVAEAEAAVRAWEELGDRGRLGAALITLSNARYWGLQSQDALAAAIQAVEVLEEQGRSPDLALAYGNLAFVFVMCNRFEEALPAAQKASALAETLKQPALQAYGLAQEGTARMMLGDLGGERLLLMALDLARAVPDHEYVVGACIGLVSGSYRLGRLAAAERYMDMGIAYAEEHELQVDAATLHMMRHGLDLGRGDWAAAERGLRTVVGDLRGTSWGETVALALLGRLLARQGDPEAVTYLERAWGLATRSGEIQRVGPAGVAWLEWAWLNGAADAVREQAALTVALARDIGHYWYLGEALRYLVLLGEDVGEPDQCPEPWASGIRGDWAAAAAAWAERDWPYERAVELAASGRPDETLDALRTLDSLGATATAMLVRHRLRDLGIRHIPRGPRSATRDNPAGLTVRQLDVLALLTEGLTNAEIAGRLVVSTRTVDHHVSAILTKLGVGTRKEAAERAAELGIAAS
jgi:DNA-binding CsgD family transcriptional regulator/tetratricopeptide (TPR) repeat protein